VAGKKVKFRLDFTASIFIALLQPSRLSERLNYHWISRTDRLPFACSFGRLFSPYIPVLVQHHQKASTGYCSLIKLCLASIVINFLRAAATMIFGALVESSKKVRVIK